MSTKHTAGPWTTPGTDGGVRVISAQVNGRRRTIAHVYAPYIDHDESGEERDANAARIVACVNACSEINPEAVPEMLAALKLVWTSSEWSCMEAATQQAVESAIAKASR